MGYLATLGVLTMSSLRSQRSDGATSFVYIIQYGNLKLYLSFYCAMPTSPCPVLPDVVFYHHSGAFWNSAVLFEIKKTPQNVVLDVVFFHYFEKY